MTDEHKLHQDSAKAARARNLLDNDLLQDAFTGLETAYTAAWRATLIDDVTGREKLFLAINIVGKVRDHLRRVVEDGKLAQRELADLAALAERKRLFRR